jgi:hypothetical protein
VLSQCFVTMRKSPERCPHSYQLSIGIPQLSYTEPCMHSSSIGIRRSVELLPRDSFCTDLSSDSNRQSVGRSHRQAPDGAAALRRASDWHPHDGPNTGFEASSDESLRKTQTSSQRSRSECSHLLEQFQLRTTFNHICIS